jgi:hypothetical protein
VILIVIKDEATIIEIVPSERSLQRRHQIPHRLIVHIGKKEKLRWFILNPEEGR